MAASGATPTTRSVLSTLTQVRLVDLARQLEIAMPVTAVKDRQVDTLIAAGRFTLRMLVERLGRDELRKACGAHALPAISRSRVELAAALLKAHGDTDTIPPRPLFAAREIEKWLPHENDIVQVRKRQWLVEKVVRGAEGEATRVTMVCLDDDNAGQTLDVLWDLELGARVIQPETRGLDDVRALDAPQTFGAYLHALRWNLVSATNRRLFQSPFRAGIKLMAHQLTPLRKALALPRANLFIADDVGLGKTIEAGLVMSELILRQRVDFVLVVCPASVALQWKDEMETRFGLRFEVYTRAFVAKCHRERGFAVPPWSTFNRFIITYSALRRPEYFEPLLQQLGERARKSLLILDEAHTAAPASASKYAVDSRVTKIMRDQIAPRFDNRLFLSATPHNGHSNSFAALLEILEPARFVGLPPNGPEDLAPVMVRRLKSDLRKIPGTGSFPLRRVIKLEVGNATSPEVELSTLLARYTEMVAPKRGRGRWVFVNLQKRLLSSVEAFARTLEVHAESKMARKLGLVDASENDDDADDEEDDSPEGESEDDEITRDEAATRAATSILGPMRDDARALLVEMQELARRARRQPDAKALALLAWIRENQCPAVVVGGEKTSASRKWNARRLIIFTEYADTKRMLVELLRAAVDNTDGGDDRILELGGGLGHDGREAVQRAFNGPPETHPVRILVCTDAAREGMNLQAYCADLFHYDIPWNPGRMEQRNGRIDRTLQPSAEVRCHYFVYPDRVEDRVLDVLLRKVEIIREELGSLGAVVAEQMGASIEDGIREDAADAFDKVGPSEGVECVKRELEQTRALDKLRAEIDDAGDILSESRRLLEFEPGLLRTVIDEGLRLAGASALKSLGQGAFELPTELRALDSWTSVLDGMRPTRGHNEPEYEWQRKPPRPVVFEAPEVWSDAFVHLHLEHPLVQRILSRFRAQGFSAHDLSRVCVLPTSHDDTVRAVAFGRLSLFGPRATRLHDELIVISAPWYESARKGHLVPRGVADDRAAFVEIEQVLADLPKSPHREAKLEASLAARAPKDFAVLWESIRTEADARTQDAETKLATRAREESAALTRILAEQRRALERALRGEQLELKFEESEKVQREQWEADRARMRRRLEALPRERDEETRAIADLYHVAKRRLLPVGLVYLWPKTR